MIEKNPRNQRIEMGFGFKENERIPVNSESF